MTDRDEMTSLARAFLRYKLGRLRRRAVLGAEDLDDLEQEVLLRLLPRLDAYDPTHGDLASFLGVTLDRLLANLLRDRHARQARVPPTLSLDRPAEGQGASPLAEVLAEGVLGSRLGIEVPSAAARAELALDVAGVLAGLSGKLRRLAGGLMASSPAELARTLGVPESSLRDQIRLLRESFAGVAGKEN